MQFFNLAWGIATIYFHCKIKRILFKNFKIHFLQENEKVIIKLILSIELA